MPLDPPDPDVVRAVLNLLTQLGATPADVVSALESADQPKRVIPTFSEYLPQVSEAATPGTRKTYGTYWNKLKEKFGDRKLDEIAASEIEGLMRSCIANALKRRNGRDGRSAGESFNSAARAVYRRADKDGLVALSRSPAHRIKKPRRLPSPRYALVLQQLEQINHVARTTGRDPVLDGLLLRFHTETACRRRGALDVHTADLEPVHCLVTLREKGGTTRFQPVTPSLMLALQDHVASRGGTEFTDRVFRYRDGRPVTTRRYDHLWERLGRHLPWVITHNISMHWIRHTTLTWVERNYKFEIAVAYAGHTDKKGAPATASYIKAQVGEVACALSAMTGEGHPFLDVDILDWWADGLSDPPILIRTQSCRT
jgi:hypothetical protein